MFLRVALCLKPHGIKGHIKLEIVTETPENRFKENAVFFAYKMPKGVDPSKLDSLIASYGKRLVLNNINLKANIPFAGFNEISDRNKAQELAGYDLYIKADSPSLGKDDIWHNTSLIGLDIYCAEVAKHSISLKSDAVYKRKGAFGNFKDVFYCGKIYKIENMHYGDMLFILPNTELIKSDKDILIPFIKDFVKEIDIKEGCMICDLPEGYFDINL